MVQSLNRPWTIYLIHHSHTDIGYTERQEKIERNHVDFIRQAVRILKAIHSGANPEWTGFKWNCETFWAVERFWEQAGADERDDFVRFVQSGEIGLSGSYLNMTELADDRLLRSMTQEDLVLRGNVRCGGRCRDDRGRERL